jgi:hypothetical protein
MTHKNRNSIETLIGDALIKVFKLEIISLILKLKINNDT